MPARKPTILVVDDEAFIRVLLTDSLGGAGYPVLTARDGNGAMDVLKNGGVDLLITDMAMPGKDGVQTITSVRMKYPELKILAISGDQHADIYLRTARRLGAHTVLPKPFTREQLLDAVKKLVG